jgi:ketosteroid isomerase-like protein
MRSKHRSHFNKVSFLTATLLVAVIPLPMKAETTSTTAQNKSRVETGFDKWSSGTGSFFELLSEDVTWTIAGNSPFSRTYAGKKEFMDTVIAPLNARLASIIVPKVRRLYAEGDTVIALWDGTARASDGQPYNNTYAWFMKFKEGRIVDVVAFFDTGELVALWNRVPAK